MEQSSRARSGGQVIRGGSRSITAATAVNPQPEGCPPGSVLGQPPFDLMLFVSPEWNVSLVKAMMDWVSRRTGEEGA